jgi:hypothetical protein
MSDYQLIKKIMVLVLKNMERKGLLSVEGLSSVLSTPAETKLPFQVA